MGEYSIAGFTYTGRLQLDSVEFRFCGQGGYFSPTDPRYAIAFRNSFGSSEGSYIRRCSIHHGYSTAVGIHTSNGVEISQNVIWRTTDSSIKVGGRGNLVLDNLAMMTSTIQPNSPSDSHAVDFPATFDIDRGNTVRGNAAAGSTRLSFRFGGEPCLEGNLPPTHDDVSLWNVYLSPPCLKYLLLVTRGVICMPVQTLVIHFLHPHTHTYTHMHTHTHTGDLLGQHCPLRSYWDERPWSTELLYGHRRFHSCLPLELRSVFFPCKLTRCHTHEDRCRQSRL